MLLDFGDQMGTGMSIAARRRSPGFVFISIQKSHTSILDPVRPITMHMATLAMRYMSVVQMDTDMSNVARFSYKITFYNTIPRVNYHLVVKQSV
jgi:hypothetical protein